MNRRRHNRRTRTQFRRAMTLFEVILSLAIFVMAMAAISMLVTNGFRSAVRSRLQTDAVLRCRSKMAEFKVGAEKMVDARGGFEDDDQWQWVSEVNRTNSPGLVHLKIIVSRIDPDRISNVSYSLRKLVRESKPTAIRDKFNETVGRN